MITSTTIRRTEAL